jgi:hypothetical protein
MSGRAVEWGGLQILGQPSQLITSLTETCLFAIGCEPRACGLIRSSFGAYRRIWVQSYVQ